ncbi:MAG: hypothetical protein RJQ08_06045 [Salinisphaeraceae bacterium]
MTQPTTRSRLKLLVLVGLFFGPLALAALMYYAVPRWMPTGGGSKGVLVQPVQALPDAAFQGESGAVAGRELFDELWTVLTVAPQGCGDTCQTVLADTRQVRTLLHRRATRVQRVLVTGDAADASLPDKGHPDLVVVTGGDRLQAFLNERASAPAASGVIYLIDPLGNWVLYYPRDMDSPADALFKDIKHLLKLSHIG